MPNHTTDNRITVADIHEMLEKVRADRDARKVFLAMPREEQLLAILGMMAFTNSQLANLQNDQLAMKDELTAFGKENRKARQDRERVEKEIEKKLSMTFTKDDDDKLTTTQKVMAIITKRFDRWVDLFFGVLQTIITIIVMAIMYLAFGGKVP